MKTPSRPLAWVLGIVVVAAAYFIGIGNRGDSAADGGAALPPDPGYAARDARVIETGHDGRERYRMNASVVRQRSESGVIELEQLEMDYHPEDRERVAGEGTNPAAAAETWHLVSDRGEVRANGDDVQLSGNVVVTGKAPGTDEPLSMRTQTLRINTPTQFIETDAPVTLGWSGHEIDAVGMEADLKAGTLRLESEVHGEFAPK